MHDYHLFLEGVDGDEETLLVRRQRDYELVGDLLAASFEPGDPVELPTDFAAMRSLLDMDLSDPTALLAFTARWGSLGEPGFPLLPLEWHHDPTFVERVRKDAEALRSTLDEAFDASESIHLDEFRAHAWALRDATRVLLWLAGPFSFKAVVEQWEGTPLWGTPAQQPDLVLETVAEASAGAAHAGGSVRVATTDEATRRAVLYFLHTLNSGLQRTHPIVRAARLTPSRGKARTRYVAIAQGLPGSTPHYSIYEALCLTLVRYLRRGQKFVRCGECEGWDPVTGRKPRTDRVHYCSPACREQAGKRRKARATAIRRKRAKRARELVVKEGLSMKDAARRMSHEEERPVSPAEVSRWLADYQRRRERYADEGSAR